MHDVREVIDKFIIRNSIFNIKPAASSDEC